MEKKGRRVYRSDGDGQATECRPASAYRQMGIVDAPLTLAVGRNAVRHALRAALARGARELFTDLRAVREFEAFLTAAVAAAARGEKLPSGWHVPMDKSA